MLDLQAKAARAIKRARQNYAQAVARQAEAVEAQTPRAAKRAARQARAARRQTLESYRLADLAADYDGEF